MLESGVAVIAVNLPSLRVFHNISSLSLSLSSLKTGGGSLLRSLLLRSRSNIGRDEDDDEDNDAWTTTPKPPGSSSTSSTRPSQQSSSHSDHYYYMHGLPPPMAVRDFPFQEDLLQRPARVVSRGEQV
ncbi:hypothetical protein F5Y17DRAFT_157753 [Xylariaceae sp. FL0594]|nr:hypothetical protein F5Y17DRAFT_157753 [Xylariaceae sp. FL0594]